MSAQTTTEERCLVAQAVAAGCDVRITRCCAQTAWDIDVARRPVGSVRYAYEVQAADVPAVLARLLGEVSRG